MIANTNLIQKDIIQLECEQKELDKKLEQIFLDHENVDGAIKKLKSTAERIGSEVDKITKEVEHCMSEKSQLSSHKEKLDQKNYELQTTLMTIKQNYGQQLRNTDAETQQESGESTQ